MVSIASETNEREPRHTFRSGSPTGAVLDSAAGYSIPQTGPSESAPAEIVMMDAARSKTPYVREECHASKS